MLQMLKNLSKEELRRKARTLVAYAMIAMIIVLSVMAVTNFVRGYYQAKRIEGLRAKVVAAEEANKTMAESIEHLRALRQLDASVLSDLSVRLGGAMRRDRELRSQLDLLETTNETARAYLDTPIHPDVARLLEDGAHGAGAPPSAATADGELRRGGAPQADQQSRSGK